MHASFTPLLRDLLNEHQSKLTYVDIGSRNGLFELREIADFTDAYGFEPNPVEYQKLVTNATDASRFGITSAKYRSLHYFPFAIGDRSGKVPFHVTRGPGASSILPPHVERLQEIRWKGKTYKKNLAEDVFPVEQIIDVELRTLNDMAKEQHWSHIDYLKIDVEGFEHQIFQGADEVLPHVAVLRVEVSFIETRTHQKLFSEVDLLLRKYGFDLLRYEIAPAQIGFKERTTPWSFGESIGIPERYGQPLSCDAMYVNRGITHPAKAVAQAAVLIEKNYLDEALFILLRRAHIHENALTQLLRSFRGGWRSRAFDAFLRLLLRLNRL